MTVTRPKRVIFYASRKRFPHRNTRAIFNRTQPAHVPHLRRSIFRSWHTLPASPCSASPDARGANPSRTRPQRADYRRPRTPSPSRATRTHRNSRRAGRLKPTGRMFHRFDVVRRSPVFNHHVNCIQSEPTRNARRAPQALFCGALVSNVPPATRDSATNPDLRNESQF